MYEFVGYLTFYSLVSLKVLTSTMVMKSLPLLIRFKLYRTMLGKQAFIVGTLIHNSVLNIETDSNLQDGNENYWIKIHSFILL